MPITITCSNCAKALKVPDAVAGKKVRCPACKAVIAVRVAAEDDIAIEEDAPPKKAASDAVKSKAPPPIPKRREEEDPAEDEDDRVDDEDERRPIRNKKKRYDDDDDDDSGERSVKRLRRESKLAYAESRVAGPALALLICGAFSSVALVFYCPFNLYTVLRSNEFQAAPNEMKVGQIVGAAVLVPLAAIFNVMAVYGAYQMKVLQKYQMARTAVTISLIPCCSPCVVIGIPFGIWALIVLNDPKVKAAFRS